MIDKTLIGKKLFQVDHYPIEKGKIHEFAKAIQEDNPIFYSEEAAIEAGFRNIPAPLTYTQTLSFWNDNPPPSLVIGMDRRYSLHGSQEYTYYAPICAGDVLSAVCEVSDVYEKAGKRGGTMKFVVFETIFTNQLGEKVLSSRQVIIQTGGVVQKES